MTQHLNDSRETRLVSELIENACVVGLQHPGVSEQDCAELLDEMQALLWTAGVSVAERLVIKLNAPRPRFYVGSGKAEEIIQAMETSEADSIVFDDPLSPAQQRNWEEAVGMPVLDRQEVILDIFAKQASTREAELQIALARAEYDLPRLKRRWTHLSRQRGRGGTGIKGEGERQIELDARMVQTRITKLKRKLKEVEKRRTVDRKKRLEENIPKIALVGYTNSGKSSLLNTLSGAGLEIEDKLFATLDATTREVTLPDNNRVLISDTVGFIRKLPHSLVEAFKSTLEEAAYADYIVEVVDATSQGVKEHHQVTEEVLEEIGACAKPTLTVVNKIDQLNHHGEKREIRREFSEPVLISTKTGEGIDILRSTLAETFGDTRQSVEAMIPHERYDLMALLYRTGHVSHEETLARGTRVEADVPPRILGSIRKFVTSNNDTDAPDP